MNTLFKGWCKENLLQVEEVERFVYLIDGKSFLLLEHKSGRIVSSKFSLILSKEEEEKLEFVDFVTFLWGEKFYYTSKDKIKSPELNILRYLGKVSESSYPYLGVHGKYELLNGTKDYSEWCNKAKFLQVSSLGICEKNTLAGVFQFQEECKKKEIKPILGETITIKDEFGIFQAKCFVVNSTGWRNLLLINTEINVVNPSRYVTEERLLELSEGLIFVFHPVQSPYDFRKVKQYSQKFLKCYFQLESCEYNSNETDKDFLYETNKYLKNPYIKPILINDSYYLEKGDFHIKSTLNTIAGESDLLSSNQWFKTDEEVLSSLYNLFSSMEDFEKVILSSVESLYEVESLCEFVIETGVFKLPKYKMNDEEASQFSTNEELFFSLIERGFKEKITKRGLNEELYFERLETEIGVIQLGGFIDYFLILWDIIRFCEQNDILTGIGRGCFIGSSPVLLRDGNNKNIEDVQIGDKLYNYLFEGSTVVDKLEYNIQEEIVELVFDNGKTITCTQDHEIHTLNRGWVQAKDLTEKDEINFVV